MLLQFKLLSDPNAVWYIIAAVGLFVIYLLMRSRSRRRDTLSGAAPLSLARERDVEHQMQHLLVELSEMARRMSAQLDTRAQKLDLLIREADQKIERLNGLMQGPAPVLPPADLTGGDSAPAADTTAAPVAPPPPEAPAAPARVAAPAPVDPRHAEIYTLADEGRSVHDIALQLNRPKGEIELILALRPK